MFYEWHLCNYFMQARNPCKCLVSSQMSSCLNYSNNITLNSTTLLQMDFIKSRTLKGTKIYEDWNLIYKFHFYEFSQVSPALVDIMIALNRTRLWCKSFPNIYSFTFLFLKVRNYRLTSKCNLKDWNIMTIFASSSSRFWWVLMYSESSEDLRFYRFCEIEIITDTIWSVLALKAFTDRVNSNNFYFLQCFDRILTDSDRNHVKTLETFSFHNDLFLSIYFPDY